MFLEKPRRVCAVKLDVVRIWEQQELALGGELGLGPRLQNEWQLVAVICFFREAGDGNLVDWAHGAHELVDGTEMALQNCLLENNLQCFFIDGTKGVRVHAGAVFFIHECWVTLDSLLILVILVLLRHPPEVVKLHLNCSSSIVHLNLRVAGGHQVFQRGGDPLSGAAFLPPLLRIRGRPHLGPLHQGERQRGQLRIL